MRCSWPNGQAGTSSAPSLLREGTCSPAYIPAHCPGDQRSCLQCCLAQTSLMPEAMFLSCKSRTCQALPCPDLDIRDHLRGPTPESIKAAQMTGDADPHPLQMALGLCSPLTVLARAAQGQLGTVTWSPLPPRLAAVMALLASNTTMLAQKPCTGQVQPGALHGLQCQEPVSTGKALWWEGDMSPKPGELMLGAGRCLEQGKHHQQGAC